MSTRTPIYLSDEPEEDLLAYCGSYLQEEIKAEGLVRRVENVSRFLHTAALVNGKLVNLKVYEYLLEDYAHSSTFTTARLNASTPIRSMNRAVRSRGLALAA